MNDLPQSASNDPTQAPAQPVERVVGSMNKEGGLGGSLEVGLKDITGAELELPPEVSAAGVTAHQASIPIPERVANMGVVPSGHNVPVVVSPALTFPISDELIAKGLTQGVTSSWLWLSTWCTRRLKKIHTALQSVGGKVVRVKV